MVQVLVGEVHAGQRHPPPVGVEDTLVHVHQKPGHSLRQIINLVGRVRCRMYILWLWIRKYWDPDRIPLHMYRYPLLASRYLICAD